MEQYVMMRCLLYFCYACLFSQQTASSRAPSYVWPLGNTTVHREVMVGRDAHLPANNQCFLFSQGYRGLPYRSLTLDGEDGDFVDFYLDGKLDFTDFALSLFVYPLGEPKGTLLNYLCHTGNVIKLAVLEGLLFVSFWDEYGVSVGATALPDLLTSESWSHILVSRHYDTGRVKVYHNGAMVEDIDDDFPNRIRLPTRGSIRLGSSQKEEDARFRGRFACFQFYTTNPTEAEVKAAADFCLPDRWKVVPQIAMETKLVNGVEKECVRNYVAPFEDDEPEPKPCDVINMACLASGLNWKSVLKKHQWTPSAKDSANYRLVERGVVPAPADGLVLGEVMTVDKKLCSRLCLRVEGCKAFSSVLHTANTTRCVLYSRVAESTRAEPGAVYFTLV
ncbi:uncharacterized protein LOC131945003 [Physella acuta]|uniref:uncharacterized protein LOC131945003 n=1 Tax=Physella acuta TaxID=109671 RepID=UPI0027DCD4DF|nr:uncharacterized protein LOC131945003 [Physella acuta]